MTPGTVVRLYSSGATYCKLAVVVDTIAGVGAGLDLAGVHRIPVRLMDQTDKLHLFARIDEIGVEAHV